MENIKVNEKQFVSSFYVNVAYFIRPIAKRLIELSKEIDKKSEIEKTYIVYLNPLNNNVFIETDEFMPISNTIFTFKPNFVKELSEDMYPILEFRGAKKDFTKLLTILGARQLTKKINKEPNIKLGDLIKGKLNKENKKS